MENFIWAKNSGYGVKFSFLAGLLFETIELIFWPTLPKICSAAFPTVLPAITLKKIAPIFKAPFNNALLVLKLKAFSGCFCSVTLFLEKSLLNSFHE